VSRREGLFSLGLDRRAKVRFFPILQRRSVDRAEKGDKSNIPLIGLIPCFFRPEYNDVGQAYKTIDPSGKEDRTGGG